MRLIKTILLWVLSIFFLSLGLILVTEALLTGLCLIVAGLLCNPLILKRVKFNKKILIPIIPILFFCSLFFTPDFDDQDNIISDNQSTAEELLTEESTTEEPTTEEITTEESTTEEPTTEEPTTEEVTTESRTIKKATTEEPTTEYVETVWLSESGEKYHNKPDCGRMNPNNAQEVSLSYAQSCGYEPCSKCY